MRMIFRLAFLGIGFLIGIFVGVHYQKQAVQIDKVREDQQAKIQPQIEAAVAKAKIELLNRVLNNNASSSPTPAGSSGFVGAGSGNTAGPDRAQLQKELQQEQDRLAEAQKKLNASK